jgi:hypothetical protein
MTRRPQVAQLLRQPLVKLDRRMKEQVAVCKLVNGSGNLIPPTVRYSNGLSTMPMFAASDL